MTMQPFDYDVEQQDLLRRLKVAEAMQQGGLAPLGQTEVVSGVAVKKSPLEAISKIVQAYAGTKNIQSISDKQRELAGRSRGEMRTGLNELLEGLSATAGQATPVEDESGGHAGPAMTAQDASSAKRSAILKAMTSPHPQMQQIGQTMLGQLIKTDQMTQKDWLMLADKFDPESVIQAQRTGDTRMLKPKLTTHVVNGQIVSGAPGTGFKPQGDFRDKFGDVGPVGTGSNGPIMGQKNAGTGEVKFAPAGTNVHVNTQDTAANAIARTLGVENAQRVSESYKTVKEVPQMLATLDEAAGQLQAGIKSGQTAEVNLALSKIAKDLGMGEVDPTIANTETFRAKMAMQILPIMEKLKPASDTDVKFAKEAAGGSITLDDVTMSRLIDSARAAGYNSLFRHNKLIEDVSSVPGATEGGVMSFAVPFNASALNPETFELKNSVVRLKSPPKAKPGTPGAGTGGVMTLEQYLKQKGGGR